MKTYVAKTDKIKSLVELSNVLKNKNNTEIKTSEVESQDVYLFSALGDNEGFKKSISKIGCNIVGHHIYPDHHIYKDYDLKKIQELAVKNKAKNPPSSNDSSLPTLSFLSGSIGLSIT